MRVFRVSFLPFGFEGWMWDMIVLISGNFHSIYLDTRKSQPSLDALCQHALRQDKINTLDIYRTIFYIYSK